MDTDGAGEIYSGGRLLRCGHTTGTCAAAASKAAAEALMTGSFPDSVSLRVPKGRTLLLPVESPSMSGDSASCAVRKDGGDDTDATHGLLVFSEVRRSEGGLTIDGGEGVGRVTKRGLDQPPGAAAINSVPRAMIAAAVAETFSRHGYSGGAEIRISIPGGESVAVKTFNPRLGIEGGISVLGTSGIVEPMSERAIVDTIRAELSVSRESGRDYALIVPGNYGRSYLPDLGLDGGSAVMCSNFIGDAVDQACHLGFKGILVVGNLGKMVKVSGGIMDTHSRNGDCRMEIMAAAALRAGCTAEAALRMLECSTTDGALSVAQEEGVLARTADILVGRAGFYLSHRASGGTEVEAVVYSSEHGRIGMTGGAAIMIEKIKGEVG